MTNVWAWKQIQNIKKYIEPLHVLPFFCHTTSFVIIYFFHFSNQPHIHLTDAHTAKLELNYIFCIYGIIVLLMEMKKKTSIRFAPFLSEPMRHIKIIIIKMLIFFLIQPIHIAICREETSWIHTYAFAILQVQSNKVTGKEIKSITAISMCVWMCLYIYNVCISLDTN